jgi:hypothetical protein
MANSRTVTWGCWSESFNGSSFSTFNTMVQVAWACNNFSCNAFSVWTGAFYTHQLLPWFQISSFNEEKLMTENDHQEKQASATGIAHGDQRDDGFEDV